MTEAELLELQRGLVKLRRQHRDVEDCWYSCPKAPEGCCDDCNCGADAHNALVEALLGIVERAIHHPPESA